MADRRELQENVFVLLMLALAFLCRGNAALVYPHVLILLFSLLSYNLFQHWYIRRTRHPQTLHGASLVVNTALVGAVIGYSGGKDSLFWVLLLLPIFSSLIMHSVAAIWLTLAMALTTLSTFYLGLPFEHIAGDGFAVGIKIVVLVVATFVTKNLAMAERSSKIALDEDRRALERLKTRGAAEPEDRGRKAALIAREMNAPLAVIQGFASLLQEDLAQDPKLAADLRQIQEAGEICQLLVGRMLALGSSGDFALAPATIRDVFEEARLLCQTQFRQKKVTLATDFEFDLPAVPMSAVHIQQVLLNLMNRALHGSSTGDLVKVSAFRTKTGVRVSITDQLPGAFESVARALSATPGDVPAGAAGIEVARQIIVRHEGTISAEGSPEGGTVVTFTLPIKKHKPHGGKS